jgi:hypothetical protein
MKIVVYRNYNSPSDEILQSTAFESTVVNLRKFLNSVVHKGGWGNEAIEVLFQYLNRLIDIDQVILIGDAPANTKQDVLTKRLQQG